jgi:hypothetical protein
MSDDRFERDLRSVLAEMAPAAMPSSLLVVASEVTRALPHSSPFARFAGLRFRVAAIIAVMLVVVLVGVRSAFLSGDVGAPDSSGAFTGALVAQVDGAYGYAVLRPAAWQPIDLKDSGRGYQSPGFTRSDGLLLIVGNLENLGSRFPTSTQLLAQLELFRKSQTADEWTTGIERLWQNTGTSYVLVRSLTNGSLYSVNPPGSTDVTLVAYVVSAGAPFSVAIIASGSYGDLGRLEREGLLSDLITIASSIKPVPLNPSNVDPPLNASPQ